MPVTNLNWVTKTPKAKILKATVGLAGRDPASKLKQMYLHASQFESNNVYLLRKKFEIH